MITIKGDLFQQECDAICITTNGFVKSDDKCVMGLGVAKQAADRWPWLPTVLGVAIRNYGNRVLVLDNPFLNDPLPYNLVSLPVKPIKGVSNGTNVVEHQASKFPVGSVVPGWAMKANVGIIRLSLKQLVRLADTAMWTKICLVKPGCGAGELTWDVVEPICTSILDDRFVIVDL